MATNIYEFLDEEGLREYDALVQEREEEKLQPVKNDLQSQDARLHTVERELGKLEIENAEWEEIFDEVATGNAKNYFAVGDQIPVDWDYYTSETAKTTYSVMNNIIGFEDAVFASNENGDNLSTEPAMVLEWDKETPFTMQFDPAEAWTEELKDGLPAGKYAIYVSGIKTYDNWQYARPVYDSKYLVFTLTKAIPALGQIRGSGMGTGSADAAPVWKISTYTGYDGTNIETVSISAESTLPADAVLLGKSWGTGADVKATVTVGGSTYRIGRLNHWERVCYGTNRYKWSLPRRWANSDAPFGQWYTKSDNPYEVAPAASYRNQAGYLYGLSKELKDRLLYSEIRIRVAEVDTNLADDPATGVDILYDRIHILQASRMNRATEDTTGDRQREGQPYEYYVNLAASIGRSNFALWTTYPALICYPINSTTGASYWQSSPRRSNAYTEWNVTNNGHVNASGAVNAIRLRLACKIAKKSA